jgi:cell division protein FtsX
MSETPEGQEPRTYSGLLIGLLGVAVVCALAGLIWSYSLAGRLTNAET